MYIRSFAPLLAPLFALVAACSPDAPVIHSFVSGADGFDTRSYWIDDGEQVTVFDAQFTPELAAQLLAEIQAETDSPVGAVVVTSPNPDKFNGASVFQAEGAELVASEATAAAMPGVHAYKKAYFVGAGLFTEDSYPALPEVDRSFAADLELGAVSLHVLDNPGVANTATVALVGEDLIVGDLAFPGVHAWLEGGIVEGAPTPDIQGWQAGLGELTNLGDGLVYPGRGEPDAVGAVVEDGVAYLGVLDALVSDYVEALDDPMAALTGEEAGAHYAEITAEAEAAYPNRGLSYLISYGVYGLALQYAAEHAAE